MTEELKQKAIKASDKKCVKGCSKFYRYGFQDGYIAGATENTELLSKHIIELQADKGKLIDENRQAKEIIKTLCDGYSSADISENEMIKRIAKAKAFLKE